MKKGYLILSNGTVFEGWKIGADTESVGEVVFNTGCVGYLETLTDPSYDGQIVAQTFPMIGIYGVIPEDYEGKCAVKGYIVRELCDTPSNFRSQGILDDFLKEHNVCGLCGIDTRERQNQRHARLRYGRDQKLPRHQRGFRRIFQESAYL